MSCSASQDRHASAVSSIRSHTSSAGVALSVGASAGAERIEKPSRSPAWTVKRARIVASSTSSGTAEPTAIRPEPNVRAPPSSSRISGSISPNSGRGASSSSSSTSPLTPSIARSTSCGASKPSACPRWPGANAIASHMRSVPLAVANVVSMTSVPGR